MPYIIDEFIRLENTVSSRGRLKLNLVNVINNNLIYLSIRFALVLHKAQ